MPGGTFTKPEFTTSRMLYPVNATGTAKNLTDAAATSHGLFYIPAHWGRVKLLKLGLAMAAAGGAQTTAGAIKLQKNGVDVGAPFTAASVASHAQGASVETDLNATTTPLTAIPSYTTASAGDKLEILVSTQGVGAGDQTYFPYLIVSVDSQAT